MLFTIAFRQLFGRRKQVFATLIGISVGTTVLIVAISLMDGLASNVKRKILDVLPHISISPERPISASNDTLLVSNSGTHLVHLIKSTERDDREVIKGTSLISSWLSKQSGVTAISPYSASNVIAVFGTRSMPLLVRGVHITEEAKISKLHENITSGSLDSLTASTDGIALGAIVARDLTAGVGDRLTLVTPGSPPFPVRVVAIYKTGVNFQDANAYVSFSQGSNIRNLSFDESDGISIQVADPIAAHDLADQLQRRYGYKTDSWDVQYDNLFSLFQRIQSIIYIIVSFVGIVAGFGVANVLITTVSEKTRDIAIMKSMGFRRYQISVIFLLQGFFVAIIGCMIGCILAATVVYGLGQLPLPTPKEAIVSSERLLLGKSPWYYVIVTCIMTVISLLAGILPARGAARLVPIEILRGER